MNRIKSCFTFFLVSLVGLCSAQTPDNDRSRIDNVLKNHNDFIYGDVTASDKDNALQQAMDMLMRDVATHFEGKDDDSYTVVTGVVTQEVTKVTVTRGDKYRAFVYIDKATVDSVGRNHTNSADTPTKPAVEPAKTVEKAQPAPTPVPATSSSNRVVYSTSKSNETDIIAGVLSLGTIQELGRYLPEKQKSGDIIHYDSYRSLSDPAAYYLVVCDKSGKIVAVLSPGRDVRTNLKTNQTDKADNYNNYKIIGFRLTK